MFPRPCAEFPNDNPALYDGAVPLGTESCPSASEPRTAIHEPLELAPLEDEPGGEVEAIEEATPTPLEVHEPLDPFGSLVSVLESVARDAGASDGQASALRGLLGVERLATAPLPQGALDALFAGWQLEGTAQGPRRTSAFTKAVVAWRAILRGEGEDFDSCGPATLDEWTADLLARLLGNPTLAAQIRRDLRLRGVAAFGLVVEAA